LKTNYEASDVGLMELGGFAMMAEGALKLML
jgi:hypothetical protein